jgi:hypothetical protein
MRYEVTKSPGTITYGGESIELRGGQVIDDEHFDVIDLRRQGCVLRKLLSVRPDEEKPPLASCLYRQR